jgi:outer membrane receptor protein involved in Fe transport
LCGHLVRKEGETVKLTYLNTASIATLLLFAGAAHAETFNIPSGDLKSALDAYARQTGVNLIVAGAEVNGVQTKGVQGDFSTDGALSHLLSGTGFSMHRRSSGAIGIMRDQSSRVEPISETPIQLAQAVAVARPSVETVTVTSSKLGGADVQSVPIAITALSQEQLTATQTAGGPDLVKQVPNLTFSKTNFTGYNIQIRGIGTQAISVTTDPAVAVSFNDIPFVRNHFFEQEFFDVSQVEVLRGPQGTLYGRNATSGVVNMISAKPNDRWEAQASVDVGNYNNRRLEGMLNIPVLDDKVDLRFAGQWTKRDGYAYNEATQHQIDGRDLWSGRVSLLLHPVQNLTATVVYEHFQEDDDRARSTKQLCARDEPPAVVNGPTGPQIPDSEISGNGGNLGKPWLSQGCRPESLYSAQSYQTPDLGGDPFLAPFALFAPLNGYLSTVKWTDPYSGVSQPRDLRVIASQIDPVYRAKNNTVEFNVDYGVMTGLTLTSQTAYSDDFLYSTEDFNRFNTVDNFLQDRASPEFQPPSYDSIPGTFVGQDRQFCDPQLGCSTRFIAEDRSSETARQFYQEVRLSSDFEGPLNFVTGANYLNYRTSEDYYIFSNLLTLIAMGQGNAFLGGGTPGTDAPHIPFNEAIANSCGPQPADPGAITNLLLGGIACEYIDPNPIDKVNGQGHNYFLSHNPYRLSSWAAFGEAYYQVASDVKLTGGLRFTNDTKNFWEFPSWVLIGGKGIPQEGEIHQEWKEVTGRAVINWTPKLDYTDQTLIYASYAHGYKGGGANPPGVTPLCNFGLCLSSPSNQAHPATFEPEFNDAFELGTKNSALDGGLVLNADVFYYKYKNYQISQIVDRTAINLNFDATVRGAEVESTWSPLPGLKLGFTGGYENATIDDNQYAIDLMDRTAGHSDWMVVKPFPTETSNCILPAYVVNQYLSRNTNSGLIPFGCLVAYSQGLGGRDPITAAPYVANPDPVNLPGYIGFDPTTAPNNGEGFEKNVGGNQLPNTPHFTTSVSADYSMPLSSDWAGTLHSDFYWQSNSYWRVFNDSDYDKLRGYTNVNLALIFTNQDGWQAMAYIKNVLDTTAITGAFLNSDDTSLTTNVFTTDPRLFGIRITKNW